MKKLLIVIFSVITIVNSFHDGRETATDFVNEWIVKIDGDYTSANYIAEQLGYTNLGEVKLRPFYKENF